MTFEKRGRCQSSWCSIPHVSPGSTGPSEVLASYQVGWLPTQRSYAPMPGTCDSGLKRPSVLQTPSGRRGSVSSSVD